MKVNEEVKEILRESNISQDDALTYLISLFYGYKPSYIPEILIHKINRTGIIRSDNKGGIDWAVPLFEEQIIGFEWVKDWIQAFGDINPDRRGIFETAVARMKKFFATYPDIRKDEVLAATRMYFRNLDNPKYLMKSHKFITDGMGVNKKSELKDWVDKFRLSNQQLSERTSQTVTMK